MKDVIAGAGRWTFVGLVLLLVAAMVAVGLGKKRGTRLYAWRMALYAVALTLLGGAPTQVRADEPKKTGDVPPGAMKSCYDMAMPDPEETPEVEEPKTIYGPPPAPDPEPEPDPDDVEPMPTCYKPMPPLPPEPPTPVAPTRPQDDSETLCYRSLPDDEDDKDVKDDAPVPTCYEPMPPPPPPPPTCYAPMPAPDEK
jgi:hypothetical protein